MADDARVRVGVLAPMPAELKAVRRAFGLTRSSVDGVDACVGRVGDVEVIATTTGMGTVLARAATERMLDLGVSRIVVSGIAGGVDPALQIGDLVVPDRLVDHASGATFTPHLLGDTEPGGAILTTDELLDWARLKPRISEGIVAVDMENTAVAAACEERGVPWTVFRGISDRLVDKEIDNAIFTLAHQDGTPNPGAIARYVLRNPLRLRLLAKLGKDMVAGANAAARAALAAVRTL